MINRTVDARVQRWLVVMATMMFLLCLGISSVAGDQQTFLPSRDTTIYEESDHSDGAGSNLIVGRYTQGEETLIRRALIAFDLTAIPEDAQITEVSLSVFVNEVEQVIELGQSFYLYRLLADWGEGLSAAPSESWNGAPPTPGSATWNFRSFDTLTWNEPGSDVAFIPSRGVQLEGGLESGVITFSNAWLLRDDVQFWVNHPETNFGWAISSDNTPRVRGVKISSHEDVGAFLQPELTVVWTFPKVEQGLSLTEVVSSLNHPVGLVNAGDGSERLFVSERDGQVRIYHADAGLLPTPFLDLSPQVYSAVDGGLPGLGLQALAFHPGYPSINQFFISYTYKPVSDGPLFYRVSRFAVSEDEDVALPAETVILQIELDGEYANGSDLHFGPDGELYVSIGDSEGADGLPRDGSVPSNLKGKVLKINVDGVGRTPEACDGALVQNYTVTSGGQWSWLGACEEILHLGLHEPRRFSLDSITGNLLIGDVGDDTFEEVDIAYPEDGGLYFGWPCMEGLELGPEGPESCIAPVGEPNITYPHLAGYCGVTGGYVYRGKSVSLQGQYVFGDRCTGTIWFAPVGGISGRRVEESNRWDNPNIAISNLVSFGVGEDCEQYVVDMGETDHSGSIYRLEDSEQLIGLGFETYDCR